MGQSWTASAMEYLRNSAICPRCDSSEFLYRTWCPQCGADFTALAGELQQASARAAFALELRQGVIDRVPQLQRVEAAQPPPAQFAAAGARQYEAPLAVGSAPQSPSAIGPVNASAPPSTSHLSVQSVLAVAGAGLVAVAAIVFTFFNPDLSDVTTRSVIVGAVTIVFGLGAVFLARRGLAFSAEAVGALGMVFAALDLWALAQAVPEGPAVPLVIGAATLVGSSALVLLAAAVRLRVWLWVGLVGVAVSPVMLALAADDRWVTLAGSLAAGFVSLGLVRVIAGLRSRFSSALRTDSVTLTSLRVITVAAVLLQAIFLSIGGGFQTLAAAAAAVLLAILSAMSARSARGDQTGAWYLWSFLAGALGSLAVALAALSMPADGPQFIALAPLGATVGAVALDRLRRARLRGRPSGGAADRRRLAPSLVRAGAWTVVLIAAAPAAAVAIGQVAIVLAHDPDLAEAGPASVIGLLLVTAGATMSFARSGRRSGRSLLLVGLWAGALAVLALASWASWATAAQVLIAVVVASAVGVVVPRRLPAHVVAPFVVLAHALLVLAAAIAWSDPGITVWAGVATTAAVVPVAGMVPRRFRAAHVAVGFAFALAVFARMLELGGVEVVPILCLTTVLASAVALVATLVGRVPVSAWYAVLGVTAVPFLLGIVSVVLVRSGWTALSTAVILALALTLVLTTRTGLNRWVRAAAAGLLIPASAVIVVCLGAQVLIISASPVTLPVIATIVAAALALTPAVGRRLALRLPASHAGLASTMIELSAYLTGALAVLLSLSRSAAGLGTSVLVLLLIGVGAATAGALTRRRLPWVAAAVSWTGALWSGWGLVGVDVAEAYLLPPALTAVVVGVVMTRRRIAAGPRFFAIGLTAAVVPTLSLLILVGSLLVGDPLPWRSLALAATSFALVVIAPRLRGTRLAALRRSTLVLAVVAAGGPAVQAVRAGLGADAPGAGAGAGAGFGFGLLGDPGGKLLVVLVFTGVAVALTVVAGRQLASPRSRRTAFMPAALFAVAGPIAAVDGSWAVIVTLWLLMAALLLWMLATVRAARTRPVVSPPVLFLFPLAWVTAVAGWSARELRVEAFSLPLGVALLVAGVLVMRDRAADPSRPRPRPVLTSWPVSFAGSWRLLTPGIFVTFVPSMLATATDPLTWRAILVIALALAAILLGSLFRLGAPFILGILVLPIENAIVFLVQIGRSIGAAPWWMTLATAGAVLLLIAVTSERRTRGAKGGGARLSDLG
ncbi:SCO7613 C-terminal domain-containing membrane protein [Herbiconiux liukaitaii]|uniref:SCO7613 C-terminal domain-containing membrane protein n=1 Tax=Herbiconiux liukaitaii TaxID=3342799 RepID=UPI0035BAF4F0